MPCEVSFQSDIRALGSNVCKKIKFKKISPELFAALAPHGPEVGGGNWQICQTTAKWFILNGLSSSIPFQNTLKNFPGAI